MNSPHFSAAGPAFHLAEDSVVVDRLLADGRKQGMVVSVAQWASSDSGLILQLLESVTGNRRGDPSWELLLDTLKGRPLDSSAGFLVAIRRIVGIESSDRVRLGVLAEVLEESVRWWRDACGGVDDQPAPIPFHVVLEGDSVVHSTIRSTLLESVCLHSIEGFAVVELPSRLTARLDEQKVQRLLAGNVSVPRLIEYLRDRGLDWLESKYFLASRFGIGMREAEALIDQSQIWSDVHRSAQEEQEWAKRLLNNPPEVRKIRSGLARAKRRGLW